ncbi:MAG: anti-sigma factor domain-containing protein [Firmicutes bacterium]|nr:anti-sigma factor domain-containing protein [Bacillota bacterium]
MSNRGIVISIEKGRATVLLPGGKFRSVSTHGQPLDVGQEIWVPQKSRRWYAWLAVPAAAAATILLGLPQPGTASPAVQAAAVLSVDINPSINLNISSQGKVLSAVGLDRGGRRLVRQDLVTGLAVPQAIRSLISAAAQDGYFSKTQTVVIGAVFSQKPAAWFSPLSQVASGILKQERVSASVVAVSGVSSSLVKEMEKPEVSVGRYLLWQRNSQALRQEWSLNQVRKMPVADLLKPILHPGSSGSTGPVGGGVATPRSSASPTPSASAPSSSSASALPSVPVLPNLPISIPSLVVNPPVLPVLPGTGGEGQHHHHGNGQNPDSGQPRNHQRQNLGPGRGSQHDHNGYPGQAPQHAQSSNPGRGHHHGHEPSDSPSSTPSSTPASVPSSTPPSHSFPNSGNTLSSTVSNLVSQLGL